MTGRMLTKTTLLCAAAVAAAGVLGSLLASETRPLEILGWVILVASPVLPIWPALRRGPRDRCAVLARVRRREGRP